MQGKYDTDIIGRKYGMLTIISEKSPIKVNGQNKRIVLCQCDCGNIVETRLWYLSSGEKQSCGCLKRSQNGFGTTRLCKVWNGMHRRCENPKATSYERYGGRGIKVCDAWSGKDGFMAFREWALANGYKEGLTIDRIDVNGWYSPDNCRWATYKEQNNNQTDNHWVTYKGKTHTISEWSDITGISQAKIAVRLNKLNYSIGEALEYEPHKIKHHRIRKVIQLDKNTGEILAEYNSLKEANDITKVHWSSISKCCSGKFLTAGGYKWKYA